MEAADYVIVGAGAAGPVLASRLSEDPHVQVLLLEAGEENTSDVGRMQGAFFKTWGSDMDWGYQTVPQAALGQRRIAEPRGRVIGGSTALNVGAWLRGCAADYDAWEAAGAIGWNWALALDIFKRIEDTDRGPSSWRGRGGPVTMVDLPTPTSFSDTLLQAFTDAGLGPRGDVNGQTPYAADRYQTLFPGGVRRTPADAYLSAEVRARPNLRIRTGALVTKVLMRGRDAFGVAFRHRDREHQVGARREVVLCAGAFGTPHLLMHSGIGPSDHLQEHGLAVAVDLPAVGQHLQEHVVLTVQALSPPGRGGPRPDWPQAADLDRWRRDRGGPAAYWVQNGVGFICTQPDLPGPDVELMFQYTPDITGGVFSAVPDAHERGGYTIAMILLQPRSRGTIRLTSADPLVAPLIDPALLSDPADAATLKAALRVVHRIVNTPTLREHTELLYPARDVSAVALHEWMSRKAGIAFHPVGTARMGAADDLEAVVDPTLRVRGVKGLRVADASVFPSIIRGHTMAPTLMVAERAAQLILSDV